MTRITCRTPASAKPIWIERVNLGTAWVTVAEAPDFSIPDSQNQYPDRDPLDATRAIRPGEVFFLTPVKARNKTANTSWIEARIVRETGATLLLERITVPANDSVQIIVQGLSLLKRLPSGTDGDVLQFRSEAANAFDLTGMAQERLSEEHIGVV